MFCNKYECVYGKITFVMFQKIMLLRRTVFEIFARAITGSDVKGEHLHGNRALLKLANNTESNEESDVSLDHYIPPQTGF